MLNKKQLLKYTLALSLDLIGIALLIGAISLDLILDVSHYAIGTLQIVTTTFGFILILISSFIITPQAPWKTNLIIKSPSLIVFMLSTILLIINLIGILLPARNPAIYEGVGYAGKVRVPKYSAEEVFSQMNRDASIDEQYPEYTKRLTQLIFDGTVHYWEEDAPPAYNLRIDVFENFLILFENALRGENENYEFCRAEKAIERATCVCSQSSKILADILGRNRIPAHIIGLEGHVVVRARVDKENDTWWLLDADYGVVIEHDIDEVEKDLQLVRKAYQEKGYSDGIISKLMEIYSPEDNQTIDENHQCGREDHFYLLKWLLPILGVIPFPMFLLFNRIRKMINKK